MRRGRCDVWRIYGPLGAWLLGLLPGQAIAAAWPDQAGRIARELRSTDREVRASAIERAASLGRASEATLLLQALADPDVGVLLLAAKRAETLGLSVPKGSFLPWFTSSDARVRAIAVALLSPSDAASDQRLLTRAMADRDDRVREAAAFAVARGRIPELLAPMLQMDASSPNVRRAVVFALGELGDNPLSTVELAAQARAPSKDLRAAVVRALSRHRSASALAPLCEMAEFDPAPSVRVLAVEALSQWPSDVATATLRRAVHDASPQVSTAAITAMGKGGMPLGVASLIELLGSPVDVGFDDEDSGPVRAALVAQGANATPALRELLREPPGPRPEAAAECLGKLLSREAFGDLTAAFRRGAIRDETFLRVLGELGDERGIAPALASLESDSPRVRTAARRALSALLPRFAPFGPAGGPLRAAMAKKGLAPSERQELSELFQLAESARFARKGGTNENGATELLPAERAARASRLREDLRDGAAGARADAAWNLGALGDANDRAALESALHDDDVYVAANAAAAVARLARPGSEAQAGQILCASATDERPLVRANALGGLARLRLRCGDGSRERRALTHDELPWVREAAARAIRAAEETDRWQIEDAGTLERCEHHDPSVDVRRACRRAWRAAEGSSAVTIFPSFGSAFAPAPCGFYAIVFADGLIRSGVSNETGGVFEANAPLGPIRLLQLGPPPR